jgi:hypothetical protein
MQVRRTSRGLGHEIAAQTARRLAIEGEPMGFEFASDLTIRES